jgi:outer membrane receptor protein involved in Fe transport
LIHQVDTTGTGVLQFQNGSWARVRGSELGVEKSTANSFKLRSSIAFNSASNGLNIVQDNSPIWLGKFSASVPLPGHSAYLAGEIQAIGKRSFIWNATPYSLGSDVLANAIVTFPNVLAKGLQAQFGISNLFNHQVQFPASAEMPTPMTPGNGRNLSANISYDF